MVRDDWRDTQVLENAKKQAYLYFLFQILHRLYLSPNHNFYLYSLTNIGPFSHVAIFFTTTEYNISFLLKHSVLSLSLLQILPSC
jgi:hypothetical protein